MTDSSDPIQRLITELRKLPGVGPKSAQRMVFHMIRSSAEDCQKLADAILELKANLILCSVCNNISDVDPCRFCSDSRRDPKVICVVEEPFNILSIEKTGEFKGLYHVLHGAISPINGVGPDDLKLKNLLGRLGDGRVEEVIVATNPTIEGEATAIYISRLIKPLAIRVSRIASGIPVGSDLEYADEVTISRALSGRREY
ncbi:MAG: recombination protein RecR [Acidobacteria bacterium]|nr:MAG: recombination protein RecR [Acidobacteriota bacterium]